MESLLVQIFCNTSTKDPPQVFRPLFVLRLV